jgi:SAM-dependent methyltransferase
VGVGAVTEDGSAGDADYGAIGGAYARYRRPDPVIARIVDHALGSARTVCNVGAGAGSYEPPHRTVVAVEPSATMRAQRAPGLGPVVAGVAEALPCPVDAFDAAMTTFSVHQWADVEAGLAEMRRAARDQVVVLTCDPDRLQESWLAEYAPEVLAVEAGRYPSMDRLRDGLGGRVASAVVPIPLTCADGFNEAYYGRPEALLDRSARRSCSAWSFVPGEVHERFERELGRDLADGSWDRRHGHLRSQPTFAGSLVLVVAPPA